MRVAFINFGECNIPDLKFVNYSNSKAKTSYLDMFHIFNDIPNRIETILEFLYKYTNSNNRLRCIDIINDASKFMTNCMSIHLLEQLNKTINNTNTNINRTIISDFNIGNSSLGLVFTTILKKKNSIYGIDKCLSNRPTNIAIAKNYDIYFNPFNLSNSSNMSNPSNPSNRNAFINNFNHYYYSTNIDCIADDDFLSYSHLFLNEDYYNLDDNQRTTSNDILFNRLGQLILMIYDCLSYEFTFNIDITTNLFNTDNIDNTNIINNKGRLLHDIVMRYNIEVLFIINCMPNTIQPFFQSYKHIMVVDGKVNNLVCNTIVYRYGYNYNIKNKLIVQNDLDLKFGLGLGVPLIISTKKNTLHLVCYNTKDNFNINTFRKTIAELDGRIIIGGNNYDDLLEDGLDLFNDVDNTDDDTEYASDTFDIGRSNIYNYNVVKKRSVFQSEYDKVGLLVRSLSDYLITKNVERNGVSVLRVDTNGRVVVITGNCHLPKDDDLVVPNDYYPFNHYFVMDDISINNAIYNKIINNVMSLIL